MNRFPLTFRIFKRATDVVLAIPFAAIAMLLYPAIFIGNRLSGDRGPVLFRQERVGRNGELFRLIKFRSMRIDAEEILQNNEEVWDRYVENGFKLPPEEDIRITKFGRFLRKSSVDEMPQFWNILSGEMSCVGPRPLVPKEMDHLLLDPAHREAYLSVKPGVTGLWQISGRSTITGEDRARLDYSYVKNIGFKTDASILLRTPIAIFKAYGAH